MSKLTFESLPDSVQALHAKLDFLTKKIDGLTIVNPKQEKESDLMTLPEAAKYLRKAKPTVYGLVFRKKIPHIKKTGKLYFSRNQLDRWLQDGYTPELEE